MWRVVPLVLSPLVNAGLVVLAAWTGYLASKKRKISDISKVHALISGVPPHVLSFTDSSVRTSPWNIRSLRWAIILPMIGITTFSFFPIGVTRISEYDAVITFLMIGYLFILDHEPPSRTVKRAEFVFADSPKSVLERSLVALRKIRCEPGEYDVERGIIAARRGMRYLSLGEIIGVTVADAGGNKSRVQVVVDQVVSSVFFDFGINARLLRKFKAAMM
jgi:hypothetical protein